MLRTPKKKFDMKAHSVLFLFLLGLLGFGCVPDGSQQEENLAGDDDSVQQQAPKNERESPPRGKYEILVYTRYNLPLPVELYQFLRESEQSFNQKLMNPVENITRYNTSTVQAFNFGVYASDLAYSTVFEQNQQAILYFNTTKELAGKLHIARGYDQEIIDRMNRNMNNNDSLHHIASNAYWNACNYLEANDQINILPFIVVGGWVESMHLAINSANLENPQQEIVVKIARQRQSLENLMQYLIDVMMDSNTFEVNEDVQELGGKFTRLREIYDSLGENPSQSITPEKMRLIAKEISVMRSSYIQ